MFDIFQDMQDFTEGGVLQTSWGRTYF